MSNSPGESATVDDTQQLVRRFTLWAVDRLSLDASDLDQPIAALTLPESEREDFGGADQIRFTFDKSVYDADDNAAVEFVTPGSRLLAWISRRVEDLGTIAHASPAEQPVSVHELTDRLFSPYTIDDGRGNPGTIQIAGCVLDARPILRLTFRATVTSIEPQDELIEVLVDDTGSAVTPELVDRLGLEELVDRPKPPRITAADLQRLIEAGTALVDSRCDELTAISSAKLEDRRRQEQQQLDAYFESTITDVSRDLEDADLAPSERADVEARVSELREAHRRRTATLERRYEIDADSRLVTATIIWCNHADGKLRFRIGDEETLLPFHDWARGLTVPPFVCPATGAESWHVTVTDDGQIVAAESVQVCARTDRRLLQSELRRCTVTDQWVIPDELATCPVTGDHLLSEHLKTCTVCHQQVAPAALHADTCFACRNPQPVHHDDSRLRRLIARYPALSSWRAYRLSETADSLILFAEGWINRLGLVVDRTSLAVRHLAQGTRFSSKLQTVDPDQHNERLL